MEHVPLNDLSRTSDAAAGKILAAMNSIFRQGHFLRGPYTEDLEARLSLRLAGRSVLGVANGTDALYLALRALGVGEGDGVAAVANAAGYATSATLRAGGSPIYVDVDPLTAQMSVDRLEEVLEEHHNVVAVVMTHLYGLVGDVERVRAICHERGLFMIEDCAQAMGAVVNGRAAGTFGDVATLSFYPTKNLGAFGDAGAVVSSTPEIHRRAKSLAQYGWGERYEVTLPGGINSRIDEMQAAVLLELEPSLDTHNEIRRSIVRRFADCVQGDRYFISDESPRFVGHLAIMVSPDRAADASSLSAAGVATGVHYPIPDHVQPAWKGLVPSTSLPVTERLCDRVLTLPCYPAMTEQQVDLVATALSALS